MCVCVFIKLHISAQSGPVVLVIYGTRIHPPKGESMILTTSVCVCVCVFDACFRVETLCTRRRSLLALEL